MVDKPKLRAAFFLFIALETIHPIIAINSPIKAALIKSSNVVATLKSTSHVNQKTGSLRSRALEKTTKRKIAGKTIITVR